jgi:hypothetical protein
VMCMHGVTQALELREAKEQSLKARKKLAESTREFKKKGCARTNRRPRHADGGGAGY